MAKPTPLLDSAKLRKRVLKFIRETGEISGSGQEFCCDKTINRYRSSHPNFEEDIQVALKMFEDSLPEDNPELVAKVREWKEKIIRDGERVIYRTKRMKPVRQKDGSIKMELEYIQETERISRPPDKFLEQFEAWRE